MDIYLKIICETMHGKFKPNFPQLSILETHESEKYCHQSINHFSALLA